MKINRNTYPYKLKELSEGEVFTFLKQETNALPKIFMKCQQHYAVNLENGELINISEKDEDLLVYLQHMEIDVE